MGQPISEENAPLENDETEDFEFSTENTLEPVWDKFIVALENVLAWAAIVASAGNREASPYLKTLEYKKNVENPVNLPNVNDLVLAERLGLIDETGYTRRMRMLGYGPFPTELYRNLDRQLINLGQAIELLNRGDITRTNFEEKLKILGYKDNDIKELYNLRFSQPSVNDLVRFVVRDTYSPEVRNNLRLDEDYPSDITERFEKLGYNEDYAKRIWASHWDLPSISLAFNMLHRGEITEEDIDIILKASDILPRFREPIKNVAYSPYTRVDVRRMHKLGILNREQVKRAYQDLGYNEERAENLTKFTEVYNYEEPEEEDTTEIRNLTRNVLRVRYRNGDITTEEIQGLLVDIGYSSNHAEALHIIWDLENDYDDTQDRLRLIRERYKNGVIDYNEAVGNINELVLRDTAQELEIARLGVVQEEKERSPTLSNFTRFLKQGLIGREEFIQEVMQLGYSEYWTSIFYLSYAPVEEDEEEE